MLGRQGSLSQDHGSRVGQIEDSREPLIVLVGFLGAGKTTLLKRLTMDSMQKGQKPFIVINDYQNAAFDAQPFVEELGQDFVKTLNGSCICCTGVNELRSKVNDIPSRPNGITLIEANGTSDACTLMEFLGVGIDKRFAPPVQLSVVSASDWQGRGVNNELEANQVQVSSLILLSHLEDVDQNRIQQVKKDLYQLNPYAEVKKVDEFRYEELFSIDSCQNSPQKMDHQKAHWSSCSIDLPDPICSETLRSALQKIPDSILRVKGCTRLDGDEHYSYFERLPNQNVFVRPNRGRPYTGPKMIAVGPGSDPDLLGTLF